MEQHTIGIIGGTGHMGRWFERFFSENGHTVLIAGRKTPLGYRELADQSDIVILSVPLQSALRVAADIGPGMRPDQLLMDFCSLKEDILEHMLASTTAEVLGCHPLFGPMTDSLKGQNVVFCPGRGSRWKAWLEAEFTAHQAVVSHLDAGAHDRHMAVVQGLTHLMMIGLGRTLQRLDLDPETLLAHSTPVFRVKLDLVGRLFDQDLDLFRNLVGENRHVQPAIETFLAAMTEASAALAAGAAGPGTAYLEEIRRFLGGFCRHGLEESNRLLETIYPK